MSENPIPATKHEPSSEPGEFNFAKPTEENPRIRRRSLKAKPAGLIKPAGGTPPVARELEREAPPLSAEQVAAKSATGGEKLKGAVRETPTEPASQTKPDVKTASPVVAPPRTTPSVAATSTATTQPAPARDIPKVAASAVATAAATTASSKPAAGIASSPAIRSTATPTTSPHGTRPATLYYSSQPRKDTEAPSSPMKTIPTASSASSSSSSAAPASSSRPAAAASRPTSNVDYRANVERQSREQKSVGNILSYVVYALIAFFVISAGLAIYGADVIFKQLHDQSVTVTDLDKKYADANQDLTAKLTATQDTLATAQAQIARQQDLILKQQEDINKLIAAANDTTAALRTERATRAQETANLRERVRGLEERPTTQKY